jgi:hypothetical protein
VGGSADAVTQRDAQDAMLNDLRSTSLQTLNPEPPGQ